MPGEPVFKSRDLVITVPITKWEEWLAEGDCAGDDETSERYFFSVPHFPKRVACLHQTHFDIYGQLEIFTPRWYTRVYVVCGGKLRGYAPLVHIVTYLPEHTEGYKVLLERQGKAVAVTIDQSIKGFQGYRYRWWHTVDEKPFPKWKTR